MATIEAASEPLIETNMDGVGKNSPGSSDVVFDVFGYFTSS
jgi:hypothetical protein